MGLLNSNIGYQIGQLAGGLWAKNFIERDEEKDRAAAQQDIFNQTLQNWHALGRHVRSAARQADPYNFQANLEANRQNHFNTQTNYLDFLNNSKW